MKFLLIFLSTCSWNYDCVHEIKVYETYNDCADARDMKYKGYWTICAAVTENDNREFDVESIGEVNER